MTYRVATLNKTTQTFDVEESTGEWPDYETFQVKVPTEEVDSFEYNGYDFRDEEKHWRRFNQEPQEDLSDETVQLFEEAALAIRAFHKQHLRNARREVAERKRKEK